MSSTSDEEAGLRRLRLNLLYEAKNGAVLVRNLRSDCGSHIRPATVAEVSILSQLWGPIDQRPPGARIQDEMVTSELSDAIAWTRRAFDDQRDVAVRAFVDGGFGSGVGALVVRTTHLGPVLEWLLRHDGEAQICSLDRERGRWVLLDESSGPRGQHYEGELLSRV